MVWCVVYKRYYEIVGLVVIICVLREKTVMHGGEGIESENEKTSRNDQKWPQIELRVLSYVAGSHLRQNGS